MATHVAAMNNCIDNRSLYRLQRQFIIHINSSRMNPLATPCVHTAGSKLLLLISHKKAYKVTENFGFGKFTE